MARIEHFFKSLFGDDDGPEKAGHYREAVRRGGQSLQWTSLMNRGSMRSGPY
jgi:hypothetical protein